MNESIRLPSVFESLACITMVSLVGCVSPDLGVTATTPETIQPHVLVSDNTPSNAELDIPAAVAMQPASRTSLTSTRLVSSEILAKPSRNPIIDLPAGSNLRDELDAAQGGVLLDFYADWCGPCRQQGKLLHEVEDVATETGTTIIKINVDNHPDIARALSVQSLPTLLMVKQGKVTHRQTGVATPQRLASWMQ